MNKALTASSGLEEPVNEAPLSSGPTMLLSRLISVNEINTIWPCMLVGICTLSAKSWKNAPVIGMNW